MLTDVSTACNIGEAWLASGTALVSAPSLQKGIALEMELTIAEGFSNPMAPRDQPASPQAPVAHFSIVFETSCADSSCVLYMIEVGP
ncbi:hypothetical protein ANCDUO_16367 [Ancylostoma duodenale]|uniref:Uncharacterized protein n=1 Tax=Ancylostoma duodenale TaxID=51022 RepID=A0A0C2FY49_9BILA|nr:hypothetical protein ANCDUO_16367 [Ancylostoma duodenale]